MPPTSNDPKTLARQDLKHLYYFLSNNLAQIASRMNNEQKQEFWYNYQTVEGLYSQSLFIGLLTTEKVNEIGEQIRKAKSAVEKLLLGMQNVVENLNAFKSALDVIQAAKSLVGGAS